MFFCERSVIFFLFWSDVIYDQPEKESFSSKIKSVQ